MSSMTDTRPTQSTVSQPLRVGVLMGGPSAEYAVSISSGAQVVRSLIALGHTPLPILVTPQETWHQLEPQQLLSSTFSLEQSTTAATALLAQAQPVSSLVALDTQTVDVVFIAMHGPYGEDGKVQALLELLNLPYTGSGVLTSAVSMDKVQFRRLMKAEGIPIPASTTFTNESTAEITAITAATLGEPPFIVKPNDQGSSIGVSLVNHWHELADALSSARKTSNTLLVDRYIAGRELTVGVIGSPDSPQALPITEIITSRAFFDYEAKYLSQETQEICPADLSPTVATELQQLALKVFTTVGARGFARVDFILDEQENPYVLEINTIPGLTPASLLPKAAVAAGMTFEQLIAKVLAEAVARR